jgi:Zn-dependent peptidase ImmA (M78 family)/transcriptional regulator with XRE-family HTH domain
MEMEMGRRIAAARAQAGMTQQELGEKIGSNRYAVLRLEKGERNVSAFELALIAEVLGASVRDLLGRAAPVPAMAMAHRVDAAAVPEHLRSAQGRATRLFELEGLLDQLGVTATPKVAIPDVPVPTSGTPSSQGRRLAGVVRVHLRLPDGPLPELSELVERRMGIDVSLEPMPDDVAGLCVLIEGRALAMANSSCAKGRQRFTVAHEVCHILCGDPIEVRVECEGDPVGSSEEVRANAFARHFLLPISAARREFGDATDDAAIMSVMYSYGISLQALLIQLIEAGLINEDRRTRLQAIGPAALSTSLGFRTEWNLAYRECMNVRRPPSRLETRCFDAYRSGLIGIGPVADLLGEEDAEALRVQLAGEGIHPHAYEPDASLLV